MRKPAKSEVLVQPRKLRLGRVPRSRTAAPDHVRLRRPAPMVRSGGGKTASANQRPQVSGLGSRPFRPTGAWFASATGQYLAGSSNTTRRQKPNLRSKSSTSKRGQARSRIVARAAGSSRGLSALTTQYLAAGNLTGEIRVWELSTGKELARFEHPSLHKLGNHQEPLLIKEASIRWRSVPTPITAGLRDGSDARPDVGQRQANLATIRLATAQAHRKSRKFTTATTAAAIPNRWPIIRPMITSSWPAVWPRANGTSDSSTRKPAR